MVAYLFELFCLKNSKLEALICDLKNCASGKIKTPRPAACIASSIVCADFLEKFKYELASATIKCLVVVFT